MCTTKTSGDFSSISGSGVIIDSRGVILTNSHVAQFFLLHDYPTPGFLTCLVRTGSPAAARYTADLLFMPPTWVAQNASKINDGHPTGSGEHDYALLYITGSVNSSIPLPTSFPFLPIETSSPQEDENVVVTSYPAGFLGGIAIADNLYAVATDATIGTLYTFIAKTVDLFSIGGTIAAQEGSSGGAVVNGNGALTGLITTEEDATSTASRDLRALSTSYIMADFAKESGTALPAFLEGDIVQEATSFNLNTAPTLTAQLVNALEKK